MVFHQILEQGFEQLAFFGIPNKGFPNVPHTTQLMPTFPSLLPKLQCAGQSLIELTYFTDHTARLASRIGTFQHHQDYLATDDLSDPEVQHTLVVHLKKHPPKWLFLCTDTQQSCLPSFAHLQKSSGNFLTALLQGEARNSSAWIQFAGLEGMQAAFTEDMFVVTNSLHFLNTLKSGPSPGTNSTWSYSFATTMTQGISVQCYPEVGAGPDDPPAASPPWRWRNVCRTPLGSGTFEPAGAGARAPRPRPRPD